jgi:hypothetical protein
LNVAVKLTRTFSAEQYAMAMQSWQWLDLGGKTPLFTSPFGDIFFRASDGFWWLDTLEGSLTRPWPTAEQTQAELNTPHGQDQYLLAGLAKAAASQGLIPAEDQIYDFTVSPVLGGAMELANVGVIDFVVGVNIAGQLHEQVRGLPEGTGACHGNCVGRGCAKIDRAG